MENNLIKKIRVSDVIGGGYDDFWRFKGRIRAVKGSRGSKKSKTTALWIIIFMMRFPWMNTLVVRKVAETLKGSCYTELVWAINRLGVQRFWECKVKPLEITYKPTGQMILFRGLDNAMKVTSIAVATGVLSHCWIEEAYEINKEEDFDMLSESIRGTYSGDLEGQGVFKQITLTFNPWNERHWMKRRFFDNPSPDIFTLTTNYMCNEWLDASDLKMFEDMKKNNPRRYKVAGLGEWGIVDGLIYENWEEANFDVDEILKRPGAKKIFGMDFGYSIDPTALFCGVIDKKAKELFVFDEMYERGLSDEQIAEKIKAMGYGRERIWADPNQGKKSINELKRFGLNTRGADKFNGSVLYGINKVMQYKIYVLPRCVNFMNEISNYAYERDKFGNITGDPDLSCEDHLMDGMRYAVVSNSRGAVYSFA